MDNHTISIAERQALIVALPCFSMLTPNESAELSGLFSVVKRKIGETIVVEDDIVDSVYVIVSGEAEVSKNQELLAILYPGEAIGLNDTGFFSATGKRTATVRAFSPMRLLKLDVQDLFQFLKRYPHLQTAMRASADKMLRMFVIKKSLPFSQLSSERVEWLLNQIESVTVPAGTIIFRQDDQGDFCYLIQTGQVEILAKNEDGSQRRLSILKSPTLFGEATFITHEPRNATAKALEQCELLALRNEHLLELIETEKNVATMFMHLMIDRSRPEKNAAVTEHPRHTTDGQEIVILKNATGAYFKLSQEGWFIWQQLNGKQTLQEITLALAEKFNVFAPDVVAALISKLAKAGFIHHLTLNDDHSESQPLWVKNILLLRKLLEFRIALGDSDKWITRIYQRWLRYLFTPLGQVMIVILSLMGIVAFTFSLPSVTTAFKSMHSGWFFILLLIPFTIFSALLHEMGHALSTKFFGNEVHYMGVGWYWLGPVAFTDTSDMWLSGRWPRIIVNLAGIWTDILVAGICALLIFVSTADSWRALFWVFALYTYINAFRMLSPLQEWDGYYILMDLLDAPRLRQSAVLWLMKNFPRAIRQPALFLQHPKEVCYWVVCIIYLVLVCTLTILLQSFIFHVIGAKPPHYWMNLILPVAAVVVSSLSIVADIRSRA